MDWDKFTFEFVLNQMSSDLMGHIINIEAYREAALNLLLPPEWRDQLNRLNRARQVHGTTGLEGNPLSEEEVLRKIDILESKPQESPGSPNRLEIQIINAARAQAWARKRFVPDSAPLGCSDILEMHRTLTENCDLEHNVPGRFRTFSVTAGSPELGGIHRGAPYERLGNLMREFVEFVGSRKLAQLHPVIHALLAHFFLVTIHPFGDGNGRVSRLVEAGILFQKGYNVHGFYGLSNYFYQHEQAYKTTLQKCREQQPFDVTAFVNFGIEGFAAELKGINNFIKTKLNRVVYRAMMLRAFQKKVGSYRRLLNLREHNLLDFLLIATEPTDPFSANPSRRLKFSELHQAPYVKGAYKDVTTRTFYRELDRLGEMGFIAIRRDESEKDWTLELDFEAIGKY